MLGRNFQTQKFEIHKPPEYISAWKLKILECIYEYGSVDTYIGIKLENLFSVPWTKYCKMLTEQNLYQAIEDFVCSIRRWTMEEDCPIFEFQVEGSVRMSVMCNEQVLLIRYKSLHDPFTMHIAQIAVATI